MSTEKKKRREVVATFKTSRDVIAMLDRIAEREERSRSDIIHRILRGDLVPEPIEPDKK